MRTERCHAFKLELVHLTFKSRLQLLNVEVNTAFIFRFIFYTLPVEFFVIVSGLFLKNKLVKFIHHLIAMHGTSIARFFGMGDNVLELTPELLLVRHLDIGRALVILAAGKQTTNIHGQLTIRYKEIANRVKDCGK